MKNKLKTFFTFALCGLILLSSTITLYNPEQVSEKTIQYWQNALEEIPK